MLGIAWLRDRDVDCCAFVVAAELVEVEFDVEFEEKLGRNEGSFMVGTIEK